MIVGRGLSSITERNPHYLQPPSSGISSLGLHSYAGKAAYVRNKEDTHKHVGSGAKSGNIAVVRPQQQLRNHGASSGVSNIGNLNHTNDILAIEPPTNRRWYNLFGVIDTEKLGNLCGRRGIKRNY